VDEARTWNLNLDYKNESLKRARKNIGSYIVDKRKMDAKTIFPSKCQMN